MGSLVDSITKRLIGTPYVAKTLEQGLEEKLVVNLTGLDCTTFVESVMGITLTTSKGKFTYNDYLKELEQIRYRYGKCNGYASRLHYFSEWLIHNTENGNLVSVTHQLSGIPYKKTINFMSTHRSSYTGLEIDSCYNKVIEVEQRLEKIEKLYIPKSKVRSIENGLKTGDVIGITTSIGGLDIVHMGFAFKKNDRIHLLHASSDNLEVVVSEEPLAEYLSKNKIQTGIIVARINKRK